MSLTDEQLAELQQRLERAREEAQRDLASSTQERAPVDLDLPIGRLTRMDAMQQQQMASAHKNRLVLQINQIDAALAKIRFGSFGACAYCDEPIGLDRLRARPEAALCVSCHTSLSPRR